MYNIRSIYTKNKIRKYTVRFWEDASWEWNNIEAPSAEEAVKYAKEHWDEAVQEVSCFDDEYPDVKRQHRSWENGTL